MRVTMVLGIGVAIAAGLLPVRAFGEGACCLYDCLTGESECVILSEVECTAQGGLYGGDGTDCPDCPVVADVPDPSFSTVIPADALNGMVLCPAAPDPVIASVVTIYVASSCDGVPIAGATVVVEFGAGNPLCPGATVSGVTNGDGEVTLVMSGSGCTQNEFGAAIVKASGVTIRDYRNAKSPDADSDGQVTLGDLVPFSDEFLGISGARCHDYNNSGNTGIEDLVIFSEAFLGANHCP